MMAHAPTDHNIYPRQLTPDNTCLGCRRIDTKESHACRKPSIRSRVCSKLQHVLKFGLRKTSQPLDTPTQQESMEACRPTTGNGRTRRRLTRPMPMAAATTQDTSKQSCSAVLETAFNKFVHRQRAQRVLNRHGNAVLAVDSEQEAIFHPTLMRDKKSRDGLVTSPLERKITPALTPEYKEELIWGSTRRISDDALIRLTLRIIKDGYRPGIVDCRVVKRTSGTYNKVHVVEFNSGDKYVIRVPRFGTKGSWRSEDAVALRSQALTMRYISQKTDLPIPRLIAYDTTHDNDIGHPYILMTFLEGSRVCDVWDNEDFSPNLEMRRLQIIKSLAYTMTSLKNISFDMIGMLRFGSDEDLVPQVGPRYEILQGSERSCGQGIRKHESRLYGPLTSSHDLFREMLANWWETRYRGESSIHRQRDRIYYQLLSIMVDCVPSAISKKARTPSPRETFVLAPPDFNWQNILVDDKGKITGVLDWDTVSTVSKFQGWAATPHWLAWDWDRNYNWVGDVGNSPLDFARYRQAYARFMKEALNGQEAVDSMFTAKSHLFCWLMTALSRKEETKDFLEKTMSVALPRVNFYRWLDRVSGSGWQKGEWEFLRGRLTEVFDCTHA